MKKWMYDVILGVVILICAGVALLYSYTVEVSRETYFLARPDTYMALWLILLMLLAVLLVARGIRQRKTGEGQTRVRPIWTKLPLITVGVLFFYLLFLNRLGFILDSIWMLWLLIFVYTMNSGDKSLRDGAKRILVEAAKSGIFAVASSMIIYYVFTEILSTQLPTFHLF